MINLYRFNKIIGNWKIERTCLLENAEQWLEIFKKDEPNEIFKLAKKKPK